MADRATPPPHGLPYIAGLDGVRAIAVAGVLLYHGGVGAFSGGFLGVDVFFVLSGYLITSLLLRERTLAGSIDLAAFWMRRARRLLPAVFLLVGVCTLITAIFFPDQLPRARGDAIASFFYFNNWHQALAHQSYFAMFGRPPLLLHLWSLAVEEQFYLVWPIVLAVCLNRFGRWPTALVTLIGAAASALAMGLIFRIGHDPSRVYYGTDTHASGLLIGALLACALPLGGRRPPPTKGRGVLLDVLGVAALVAIFAAMTGWHDYDTGVYRGGLLVFSLPCALLLICVTDPAAHVGPVLGVAPLRWIGQRSYGIYLWHWPVMALTRPGIDLHWSLWLLVPAQIAVAVVIAAASYRWLEMPIRRGHAWPAIRAYLDRRAPHRRLLIVVAVLVAFLATAGWVAARPTPRAIVPLHSLRSAAARAGPRSVVTHGPRFSLQAKPLAIGASVMLAAQPSLEPRIVVDAAVGRQPADIDARLQSYRDAGHLPGRVIVQMGENGPVFAPDIAALRRALSGVPVVLLVNVRVPRSWQGEVNHILATTVRQWPQARVVDWHDASANPDLLYDDGIHPNPAGQKVYARLVGQALAARGAPVTRPRHG